MMTIAIIYVNELRIFVCFLLVFHLIYVPSIELGKSSMKDMMTAWLHNLIFHSCFGVNKFQYFVNDISHIISFVYLLN